MLFTTVSPSLTGGNDIWGWTDPADGREIAIMGTSDGTSFVDVTNPRAPEVLGFIQTQVRSVSNSRRTHVMT